MFPGALGKSRFRRLSGCHDTLQEELGRIRFCPQVGNKSAKLGLHSFLEAFLRNANKKHVAGGVKKDKVLPPCGQVCKTFFSRLFCAMQKKHKKCACAFSTILDYLRKDKVLPPGERQVSNNLGYLCLKAFLRIAIELETQKICSQKFGRQQSRQVRSV